MAFLKILTGHAKGSRFEIDRDEIIAGRSPNNVVHLNDPSVSGRHCVIRRQGRRYTVHDLDSTNGTLLNGVRVREYRLSPKDVIGVGSVDILFDGDDVETEEQKPIPDTVAFSRARPSPADAGPPAAPPSAFRVRRSKTGFWMVLIGLATLAVLGALGWFLYNYVRKQ
jgi:pSer/pThr/pTyr-binding forkhead associated (FHA) protein